MYVCSMKIFKYWVCVLYARIHLKKIKLQPFQILRINFQIGKSKINDNVQEACLKFLLFY